MFAKLLDVVAKIEVELRSEKGVDAIKFGFLLPNF